MTPMHEGDTCILALPSGQSEPAVQQGAHTRPPPDRAYDWACSGPARPFQKPGLMLPHKYEPEPQAEA